MRLFKLNCDDESGRPVLPISGDNYTVHNISYNLGTIELTKRVPDPESSTNCSHFPNRYLTLERTPFAVTNVSNATLFFFFRCNVTQLPLPQELRLVGAASLPCDVVEGRFGSYVGYSLSLPQPDEARFMGACSSVVSLPVVPFPHGLGVVTSYKPLLDFSISLNWTAPGCAECEKSGGRCGTQFTDNNSFNFICICRDWDHRVSCDAPARKQSRRKIIVSATAAGALFALLLFIFICCRKCLKPRASSTNLIRAFMKKPEDSFIEAFIDEYISLSLKRYKYIELKTMTNSFNEKLGQGGYGRVFKGKLKDGRIVAVKLLNESNANGQEFMNEVAGIGRTNHVNIVGLIGFCSEGSKKALIYEFMANGSLEKFLSDKNSSSIKPLQWEEMYKIAVGIAKGLEYLHKGCTTRVVHFDIKPHNILLDEEFNPKISDFGLAKLCPSKESILSMNIPRGTMGYIAPEVFSRNFGAVSSKSDVYSYGMLILEMVGVRNNKHVKMQTSETSVYFPEWIFEQFDEDGNLDLNGITSNEYDHELLKKMILTGLWCIQTNPKERPSIDKVVEMLDKKSEELVMPPKPYMCSPSRSINYIDDLTCRSISL